MERGLNARRLIIVYGPGAVNLADLQRSLSADFELLFLLDETVTAAQRKVIAARWPVLPLAAWPDHLDALAAFKADGITTYAELIPETAAIAAALDLPFHSTSVAEGLSDKLTQRQRLDASGIRPVSFQPLDTVADIPRIEQAISYPLVIKPRVGGGSRHVHQVHCRADLLRVLSTVAGWATRLIAEELVLGDPECPAGDLVSVESVVDCGVVRTFAITGKFPQVPPFRETGNFWPAAIDDRTRSTLERATGQVLAALAVRHGVVHTEFKLTAEGPRLIEVNGRLGGMIAELAARASSVDLIRLIADLACGEPFEPFRPLDSTASPVTFQYHCQPPPDASWFERINGVADARAQPGVVGYLPWALPGPIPDTGQTYRLDCLLGSAATHTAMVEVIGRALEPVSFVFRDSAGGQNTVPAKELPGWAALLERPIARAYLGS